VVLVNNRPRCILWSRRAMWVLARRSESARECGFAESVNAIKCQFRPVAIRINEPKQVSSIIDLSLPGNCGRTNRLIHFAPKRATALERVVVSDMINSLVVV